LFSLHGLCNDHYLPLLFALLPDKKTSTYVNLFKHIIHLSNVRELSLKPNLFISDFEEAIYVALRQVWDDTKIFGCRFHLTQLWYRNIQELGLSNVYQNNKTEESKWLNHTFGLPFIPPNEVSDCFIKSKHLKKRNSTKNKSRSETFQQIYENYRQNKIDRKGLVSSLSYKYKKKGE